MKVERKVSGSHKSLKVSAPMPFLIVLSRLMGWTISPAKGTQNPPHIHVKVRR
jgi:hypothetical protein